MKTALLITGLFLAILLPVRGVAQSIRVRVLDGAAAPVEKALVILRSLDTGNDLRGMTDANGEFEAKLKAGAYQIIAMYPLTWFKDEYTEVRLEDHNITVTLNLRAWHDQYGYKTYPCTVKVLDGGDQATDAMVLVRQKRTSEGQRIYKRTAKDGSIAVDLRPESILAVFGGNKVAHFEAPSKCPKAGLVFDVRYQSER